MNIVKHSDNTDESVFHAFCYANEHHQHFVLQKSDIPDITIVLVTTQLPAESLLSFIKIEQNSV